MQTPEAKLHFDEHSSRYRLCCCHVRIWAMVIGIIELVLLIFNLIGGIANYAAGKGFQGSNNQAVGISGLVGGIVGVIIGLIVVALLIYGLRKERPGFLIPHMVMQIIGIVILIIAAITYFVMAGMYGNRRDKSADHGTLIGGGVGMLISALIQIFFFYVIFRAYRYLKDKQMAGGHVPLA